jgi:hypothetical protein
LEKVGRLISVKTFPLRSSGASRAAKVSPVGWADDGGFSAGWRLVRRRVREGEAAQGGKGVTTIAEAIVARLNGEVRFDDKRMTDEEAEIVMMCAFNVKRSVAADQLSILRGHGTDFLTGPRRLKKED